MWRAEDENLKRVAAVKEVRVSAELTLDRSDELVERILREARICVGLSAHPSIVTIHDVVLQDGRPWIVMDLVEGRSLDRVVAEDGPLTPRRAAEIGRRMHVALAAAHGTGVQHLDVKPANVLVLPDGRALLTGFGIGVSDSGTQPSPTERLPGSRGYIAPERLGSGEATAMTDVWSLGATLTYAVEGHPAHSGPAVPEPLTAMPVSDPHPPRRAGPLLPVLNGMMQPDPEHRLSGRALDEALERVASGAADSGGDPAYLALSANAPVPGHAGTREAEGPEAPSEQSADGTGSAERNRPNTGTRWWPPTKDNWRRLLISAAGGLVTLILAPLLVGYIVETAFKKQDPTPTSAPIAYGDVAGTPQGYTRHARDGFSIVAPETWVPQEDDDGVTLSSPSETAYIRLEVLKANDLSPLERLEAVQDEGEDDDLGETVFLDEVPHPEGEAARVTVQGANGQLHMMLSMVALERGDQLAVAAFATPSDEWNSADEERRYAFESFRLDD